MARIFNKSLEGNLSFSREVVPKLRVAVENYYYRLSYQQLEISKQSFEANPSDIPQQFEPALISILMAAFCLEAHANNVLRDRFGEEFLQTIETEKKELRGKWKLLFKKVTEKKGMIVTGEELAKKPFYQPFCNLVKLRNKLVHYKEGFDAPVQTEWFNAAALYAEVNYHEAKECFAAMDEMIRYFHECEGSIFPFEGPVLHQGQVSITGKARIVRAEAEDKK